MPPAMLILMAPTSLVGALRQRKLSSQLHASDKEARLNDFFGTKTM